MLTINYNYRQGQKKDKEKKIKECHYGKSPVQKRRATREVKKNQGNYKRARHNMIPLVSPYLIISPNVS